MLVVKVELHSAVTGVVTTIAQAVIANDGTGQGAIGNYDVKVAHKRAARIRPGELWFGKKSRIARTGRVDNYPRLSYNVWRLVIRALLSAFPEEEVAARPGRGRLTNRSGSVETSRLPV